VEFRPRLLPVSVVLLNLGARASRPLFPSLPLAGETPALPANRVQTIPADGERNAVKSRNCWR